MSQQNIVCAHCSYVIQANAVGTRLHKYVTDNFNTPLAVKCDGCGYVCTKQELQAREVEP